MPTTRTLNPLPFLELEPHRFEDLVRQLAYDFRLWRSLEAIGRSGGDEGIDIRGVEAVDDERNDDDESGDDATRPPPEERLWIFQCKRERAISPKQIKTIVAESLASLVTPPHGFVLAVGGDVSKKARDAFRAEMITRKVTQFEVWARGELEDQLFQPQNDRLLFAYFGLSLQPRRRSLTTTLRRRIAIKKQLMGLFAAAESKHNELVVLLRDPSDNSYPGYTDEGHKTGRWLACPALSANLPYSLMVAHHHYVACVTPAGDAWDAYFDDDVISERIDHALRNGNSPLAQDLTTESSASAAAFVEEYIDEHDRATLVELRFVEFDRVLAIDPIGDEVYPFPHLFIEFDAESGPFTNSVVRQLHRRRGYTIGTPFTLDPADGTRRDIFPRPLPKRGEPPPKAFDATLGAETSIAIKPEKLDSFLPTATATPSPVRGRPSDDGFQEGFNEFERWKNDVALPVFSGFVHALRARGHRARVVLRSVSPDQGERTESVELRADIGRYQESSVRAEYSGYRGWQFSTTPADATPAYGAIKQVTLNDLDAAKLEEKVVAVLKRGAK
jgi:hypothetical protein